MGAMKMRNFIKLAAVSASLAAVIALSVAGGARAQEAIEAAGIPAITAAPVLSTARNITPLNSIPARTAGNPAPASLAEEGTEEATATSPTETANLIVDEGQVIRLPANATSVFVANPEIADVQVKSGQLLYLFGRRVGRTSFYAVDAADNILISRNLVVSLNLAALRNAVNRIASGRVNASSVEDMIMLTGSVDNASVAQDVVKVATRYLPQALIAANQGSDQVDLGRNFIINRMTIDGNNQVNLRVRFAEVSREAVKTFGITPSVGSSTGNFGFAFDSGVATTEDNATAAVSTVLGATPISATLDALVDDGLATVLAEPNLTALSGETASFLAGGEFPIPIVSSQGNVTVEFREFGVRLSFTPTIVNGNRINLRVRPEVSDRDDSRSVNFGAGEIPGLTTRRAETSIELGSGQSFAIAGLLQNNSTQTVQKFPGLAEVPILGALFRSDRFRQNQSELVIVVTPYLVKPVSASQISYPTDGFVPPNDIDRWLNGRFNSATPTPERVPVARQGSSTAEGGLVGDVGYVLQ